MYSKEVKNFLDTLSIFAKNDEEVIYIGDVKEQMVYYTSSFAEQYGFPPVKEGEGYSFDMLRSYMLDHEAKESHLGLANLAGAIGKTFTKEYNVLGNDGIRRFVQAKTRIHADENGDPRWLIGRLSMERDSDKTDAFTGLFNMNALMKDLNQHFALTEQGYLMVLGIDNLKNINNQYGRGYGNQVIKRVAKEIQKIAQVYSKVYRIDSDRFGLNLSGNSEEDVEKLYQKIKEAVAEVCTISSGVAFYKAGDTAELIYQHAENALYSAKSNGKNMQVFFSPEFYEKHLQYVELQEELRNSIRNNFEGFSLRYQAQVDGRDYRLSGAEALLSYTSQKRGIISPEEFIPVLEHTKLIIEVGEWVLTQALLQAKQWREFYPDFRMSVNLSYIQIKDERFMERVKRALEMAEITGKALTLEVTESMRLQDHPLFNKYFYRLSKLGIQISIDDFGTGYSGLTYLKSLAIDEVKIDRSFITHVQFSEYNYRLLSNIIELAHSAQIKVCCEGVEMEQELTTISKLNPDKIQGYLFARPYTAEQFEKKYIQSECEEFQERLAKEQYYRDLECVDDEQTNRLRQEKIAAIVDGMEEMIYVRDISDYSLFYMNAAGRAATGVYDYKGKKCYEVLQGKDAPCEFCQNHCNENNDYNVWEVESEHLNRHFLLKDKNIPWNGSVAKLAVAIDVTEKEIITKEVQEKLDFEKNIVSCTKMLLEEPDRTHAIQNVLQSIGEFYDADRAYLFELQSNKSFWDNTFEWCAEGVIPQIDMLQDVPIETTARWMKLFECGESILIEDVEALKEIDVGEYEILKAQDITHLIVSPVWVNKEAIGFIGVDNPRKHQAQCGQVQTMALFISDRLQKDETKKRLGELLQLHYEDVLKTTNLGLWVIRIDEKNQKYEMYADKTMLEIMGVKGELTPEECYKHWYSRINNGYCHYVQYAVQNMIETRRTVELSYTWNHPEKGHVSVRCLGLRVADSNGMICLEGYHREINEVDRPKFLPDHTSAIFEYDVEMKSVFFHNDRGLLAGTEDRECNFPACWLEKEMVHPRFVDQFEEVFQNVEGKEDIDGMEFLLKTKAGSFEWFKLRTRHLKDENGLGTVLVLIDPAKKERALELNYMRQREFYQAILSEKEAYAEIDVETGKIVSSGGLWKHYHEESVSQGRNFIEIFIKQAKEFLHPDDMEKFKAYMSVESMKQVLQEERYVEKLEIRRLLNNEMHWAELTGHVFQDQIAGNIHALVYLKDIDERKRRELEREIEATRDSLTGVYNRRQFEREVEKHIYDETQSGEGTLLILDMDHFKHINDTYGHAQGDYVLKYFSNVLMKTFRSQDIVGRLGGDEFVVFLRNMTNKEILNRRLEEMRMTLINYERHPITSSVGITFVTREDFSYEKSMKEADEALYRSKEAGRNCYFYYDEK